MEQGSPEWRAARLGKVTASRVADIIALTKTGPSASRANYMAELLCERLTGVPTEGFVNAAMEHGTRYEAEAREFYEFVEGVKVEQVGFIDHPAIPMAGASPDGLVGDDGMVEIKCPNTATHLDTLQSQRVPLKYVTQMTWQMICAQREWCDFVSYDPRLPPSMRYCRIRLQAKPNELEAHVIAFLVELDAKVEALKERYGEAA